MPKLLQFWQHKHLLQQHLRKHTCQRREIALPSLRPYHLLEQLTCNLKYDFCSIAHRRESPFQMLQNPYQYLAYKFEQLRANEPRTFLKLKSLACLNCSMDICGYITNLLTATSAGRTTGFFFCINFNRNPTFLFSLTISFFHGQFNK